MWGWIMAALLQAAAPPTPAAAPALVNEGKPMLVQSACGPREIDEWGLVCTEEDPCTVYLELSGIEQAGSKLFLSGNLHTDAVTLSSLLLVSEDEGKSWREAHPRISGAVLDQIQFVDFQTGFISGNIAGSIARDPFLLKTGDGGKSWRRIAIFDDGGYGVIGEFKFTSPAQGSLTIEGARGGVRFRQMETMTGGESWMTKEARKDALTRGRPPKPATPAAGGWRIRANARTGALHVERRQAAKWETISVFSLRAGVCKR